MEELLKQILTKLETLEQGQKTVVEKVKESSG
jgi:uncharacterized protein (UPF0335 family)